MPHSCGTRTPRRGAPAARSPQSAAAARSGGGFSAWLWSGLAVALARDGMPFRKAHHLVEAIQAGAKDFVVKPFQPSRVLEAVQRVLG